MSASGELEAGDGRIHGGLPRPADPPATAAVRAAQDIRDPSGPPGLVQTSLYFMRTLGEGMAGMTHENDIRIAEGLQNIELPADPAEAMAVWRSTLNDAVVHWHRARGCDMPDLNDLAAARHRRRDRVLLPALLSAARSTAAPRRTGSVRSGPEETLFEIWSLTRIPPDQVTRQADTTGADGARRPALAADSRTGLLQSAASSKKGCTPRGLNTCDCPAGSKD